MKYTQPRRKKLYYVKIYLVGRYENEDKKYKTIEESKWSIKVK